MGVWEDGREADFGLGASRNQSKIRNPKSKIGILPNSQTINIFSDSPTPRLPDSPAHKSGSKNARIIMNWIALCICIALALGINLFPWFMAFVVNSEKWKMVGWAYYFFTFPIGIALVVVGLILALILP